MLSTCLTFSTVQGLVVIYYMHVCTTGPPVVHIAYIYMHHTVFIQSYRER